MVLESNQLSPKPSRKKDAEQVQPPAALRESTSAARTLLPMKIHASHHQIVICLLVFCTSLLLTGTATAEDFRTFTNTKGQSIRAALVKISVDDIVLRKEDGIEYTVKAASLSAIDIEWLKTKGLVTPQTPAPAFPTATMEQPFINSLGMQFVPVPGTDLLVCMHETRKQDFAAFAKDDPRIREHWKNGMYQGKAVSSGDDHPVGYMSWHDADAFCDWLSKKEGRSYRLPSDHEWCLAAGIPNDPNAKEAKDGKLFPVERPSAPGVTTRPVMSLKPNKFGVFDLMGNVGEWCSDIDEREDLRVVRGGMWESFPDSSGFEQSGDGPTDHRPYSGFRCVLAPAPLPVPDWTPLKRVDGCVTYNPSNLKIMNRGTDGWLLTDGTVHLQLLDEEADANLALAMAKEHTQRCIIGRGDNEFTFEYWSGDSGLRGGTKSSKARICDPSEFSLEKVKDREDDSLWEFKVQFDRAGTLSCFFDSEERAKVALDAARKHPRQSRIGGGQMTYWE